MAVAIALGRDGIDTLLVVSQVVLSIVLPFVTFPLLWCTASRTIMSVRRGNVVEDTRKAQSGTAVDLILVPGAVIPARDPAQVEGGADQEQMVDYSNNKLTIFVGAAIWLAIVAANMYVIIELAMGKSGP
jgi:metal iron transporter